MKRQNVRLYCSHTV